MVRERIWYEDPKTFFRPERFLNLLPDAALPYDERLNRVVRFSMYVSILSYLVFQDIRSSYPLLLALVGTYLLRSTDSSSDVGRESYASLEGGGSKETNRACTRPTKNNPFMNVTMDEYANNPTRPEACPIPEVSGEIDESFHDTLFKEVDDVYQRSASIRNYHTLPSTTIPNAQDEFAEWCYGNASKTCKEGNGMACKYFTLHK